MSEVIVDMLRLVARWSKSVVNVFAGAPGLGPDVEGEMPHFHDSGDPVD